MDRDWIQGWKLAFIFACLGAAHGCSSGKSEPKPTPSSNTPAPTSVTTKIRVNWTANKEVDVNAAGGGYRVYYGKSANVSTSSGSYVDVPYVGGASAPTTALITNLTAGTYYVRVIAYSAYNPLGLAAGARSSDSSETSITVP